MFVNNKETPTANETIKYVSPSISNTLVGIYVKLHMSIWPIVYSCVKVL